MMTIARTRAARIAVTVVMLLPAGISLAATEPTLSDIAACNEEAVARTGGAALPGGRETPLQTAGAAPIVQGERAMPKQGGAEKADPTGSIVTDSPDPLVKGMDAQKTGDPAYRSAYRDCMKARVSR
jgi:hypothetical protein